MATPNPSASADVRAIVEEKTQLVNSLLPSKKGVSQAAEADVQATLTSSLQTLNSITRNKRAARKIARNKDTIKTLLSSITSKPRFSKLVEYSVDCLKNLAVDEVSVEEMIDEGALEVLLQVLKLNPYNEQIARAVNSCLEAFALNDYLAKMIADRIGGEHLVFSLKKHVETHTIVSTCGVLKKLMYSPESIGMFVTAGVVEALQFVCKQNMNQPDVLEAIIRVCTVIGGASEHAAILSQSGLLQSIVEAVRLNIEDQQVARAVASLFGTLAGTSDAAIKGHLRNIGVVELLVSVTEGFPDDRELLKFGALALKALATEADVGVALQGVVVGNAATDSESASSMAKLASLALVDENIEQMIRSGGIATVVAAILQVISDQSESSCRLIESGCRALMRMATTEQNVYAILQAGGVKAFISAVQLHMSDERIGASAVGALAALITRHENAEYLLKCGALSACLALMREYPSSETVALHGMRMLEGLCRFEETVGAVVSQGVIEAVIGIMKAHMHNAEIVSSTIKMLGRCAISTENVEFIVAAGGLPVLLDVLQVHTDKAELIKQALLLLETAAMIQTNVPTLKGLGALDWILHAMEAHPDNAELQEIGARALGLIAGETQLTVTVGVVTDLIGKLQRSSGSDTESIMHSLGGSVRMLSNLALIQDNVGYIASSGGLAALTQSFVVGAKLMSSEEREALLASAAVGIVRMLQTQTGQDGSDDSRQTFMLSGALATMVAHAVKAPDNELLAESIFQIVTHVASNPELAGVVVRDYLASLFQLVHVHSLNEKVLAAAVQAIGALSTSPDNIALIVQHGGAEILVEAILANMPNPGELANCLKVFVKFATSEAAVRALLTKDSVEIIVKVMKAHPENAGIILLCIDALLRLMQIPEVCAEIGDKGALPLLLRGLRDHYTEETLVEHCINLLDPLAILRKNCEKLLDEELGSIELIQWAASTFAENADLQRAAARLLETLRAGLPPAMPVPQESKATHVLSLSQGKIIELIELLNEQGTGAEVVGALGTLSEWALDAEQADMLLNSGAMQAVVTVLLKNKVNETVFRSAAVTLQNMLTSMAPNNLLTLLDSPDMIEALLELIRPHPDFLSEMPPGVLIAALDALAKLAAKPALMKKLLQQGLLDPLVKLLASSKNPDVLKAVARLLALISGNEEVARMLAVLANLRALIQAMRDHFSVEEFLRWAVLLLGNLAINDQIKEMIGTEGGVQIIVRCMNAYPRNKPLMENCCYALGNLSFECALNIEIVATSGGIEELVAAMEVYPTHSELLDPAMCSICNLCFQNDPNRRKVVEARGAKQLVAVMLGNIGNADLLCTAFRALGSLALFSGNVAEIIAEGAVQGTVAAMTEHSGHLELIDTAIRVLSNLSSEVDDRNMAIMASEGAVQAIVDVAQRHVDNLDVEVPALGCLCNFAKEQSNARMIVRQGGLDALEKSMRQFPSDSDLCEKAARLLSKLSELEINVPAILGTSCVKDLIAALKRHRSEQDLLIAGLSAISNLACTRDHAEVVAHCGAVVAILTVINEQMSQIGVLSECFHALVALCRSETIAASMAEQVMNALCFVYKMHLQRPQYLLTAFTFTSNLCTTPLAAQAAISTQLVQTMLLALKEQHADVTVLLRGCRALENMASSTNEVKDHMTSLKVEAAMGRIREEHGGKEEVVVAARRVVDAINMRIGATQKEVKTSERKMLTARAIFGDERKRPDQMMARLPEDVRNLLVTGALLTKHSNSAPPRPRYVFVTPDLKYICWKKAKTSAVTEERQRMKITTIRAVERGRCTPQLQRKKRFGGWNAQENTSFALFGRERTVDLEAKTEDERDKWVNAILQLIDWVKAMKVMNSQYN